MTWRENWYIDTVTALGELRGRGAPMTGGHAMPMISSIEAVAVLGQLVPAIRNAVTVLQNQSGRENPQFVGNAKWIPDSFYIDPANFKEYASASEQIHVDKWLAGYAPDATRAWRRTNGAPVGATGNVASDSLLAAMQTTYCPFGMDTLMVVTEPALVQQMHELLNAWERGVRATADALLYNRTNIQARINDTHGAALWAAVRQMCTALDVLRENPPQPTYDRVKGAAAHALNQTADFVGEATADIAAKIGETAGQIGEGFFREAGFMSLVVAGLAVFIFLK